MIALQRFFVPIAFIAGALSSFAMAPYLVWPLLFLGLSVLYWALAQAEKPSEGFWRSAAFGFGYFLFGLSWIGNALLVENNPYQWAYPLAVAGLPTLLCLFFAVVGYVSVRFLSLKQWHGYVGFVALMGLGEWLRGHVFTGFPWNLFGYSWEGVLEVAQLASLESIYLLSTLTVFWAAMLGFICVAADQRSKVVLGFIAVATLAGSYGFGAWRMAQPLSYHENVRIKIVQPNTPQHEKWIRGKMFRHFETALALSEADAMDDGKDTIIVWPETALSPPFLATPYVIHQIQDVLRDYHAAELISGALRHDGTHYYNSVITIDQGGEVSDIYDKSHLVPFGEYIPFQEFIPIPTITQFSGFQRGSGPDTYESLGDLRYVSLICYEILFPNTIQKDADFVVNVTNDAWYGDSAGPHQHLAKAKFRAIETGLPVIRAANTGISAGIDPYGRIISDQSTLFSKQALSLTLPTKIITHSFQLHYKNVIYMCALLLCVGFAIFKRFRSAY